MIISAVIFQGPNQAEHERRTQHHRTPSFGHVKPGAGPQKWTARRSRIYSDGWSNWCRTWNEEQERAAQENLSDEELAMFDLLKRVI